MQIKTKKLAVQFTHTLSATSKMPCKSYSLPTASCKTGGKLRHVKGSACYGCYADKGAYNWNSTQNAMRLRLASIYRPEWIEAMAVMIGKAPLFRWHDSGDIQSVKHLDNMMQVCKRTPNTRHWIPTREKAILRQWIRDNTLPANVTIRLSGAMVDGKPPIMAGVNTSTIHKDNPAHGVVCKAPDNNGECGTCRDCWNKDIPNISYKKH